MPDNNSRPRISDMPILLEPSFPTFTPRPLEGNLNKRTANLILVNTSPYKLIFKIVPNSTEITYSIRPEIDYLAPNGCRLIGISINDAPQPKREHDFTYKVLALSSTESFGISAVQCWEQNQLENKGQVIQEAQFICFEPEAEFYLGSSRRRGSRRRVHNTAETSLSAESTSQYQRHTPHLNHSLISSDLLSTSPVYYRKGQVLNDTGPDTVADFKVQCPCQCTNSNHYFWQGAATMRSFFYGFVFALICSTLAFRKRDK